MGRSGSLGSDHTPFDSLTAFSLLMVLSWDPGMVRQWRRRLRLHGRPLAFLDPSNLARRMKRGQTLWLGWGFEWDGDHTQLLHDLVRAGPSRIVGMTPERLGAHWIHGLSDREQEIRLPLSHTEGHLLVVGTTGAGKTRLFDLLVTQAVRRGEAVVIIDPKGDRDLKGAAERACSLARDPGRFVYFHPAFPRDSARIDPCTASIAPPRWQAGWRPSSRARPATTPSRPSARWRCQTSSRGSWRWGSARAW